MKPVIIRTVLAVALAAALPALAGEKNQSQQERLSHCAHESKGLKGEERQKFMSECLKGDKVREARHDTAHNDSPQNRMKACNDSARKKDLHGDERRAFMSSCLKG